MRTSSTLYDQIYGKLAINAPTPDLVVYLQAPASVLMERVRRRGMPAEQHISNDYLEALIDSYTRFFHFYDDAPRSDRQRFGDRLREQRPSLRSTRFAHRERVRHAPVLQPSSDTAMSSQSNRSHVTLNTLADRKRNGVKFAALTAYDALFAELISSAGVEVILVGDSLGMVLQGHDSTLPVTLDDMVYHMNCVHRGNRGALIMADLPFMSYASERQSLKSAATLMRAGAHIVKLEGGAWLAESSRLLTERGIPVCAHMGLTPQSINRIGGYRVQGRDPDQAHAMIEEAVILEDAGASILLLECVPVELAKQISQRLHIPTIGIGAGPHTDGQIMVMHDMLGITPPSIKAPKFIKNFLAESRAGIPGAFKAYADAVRGGVFPGPEHSFN